MKVVEIICRKQLKIKNEATLWRLYGDFMETLWLQVITSDDKVITSITNVLRSITNFQKTSKNFQKLPCFFIFSWFVSKLFNFSRYFKPISQNFSGRDMRFFGNNGQIGNRFEKSQNMTKINVLFSETGTTFIQ